MVHKERKRLIVLAGLLILLLGGETKAQKTDPNGYNKFYFESGALSSEGKLVNGKPEGYWKNYFESGVLKSEGYRSGHQLDSTWKFYNEDGILLEEISYKNGKRNGVTKKYDKEGFLASSFPYEDDKKHGVAFTYYSNGAIHTETVFEQGAEVGNAYEYSPTGDIITITSYKNGVFIRQERINRKDRAGNKQGLWKLFYDDRSVQSEGRYYDNLKDGYWKEYSPKGLLLQTYKYEKGELITDAEEIADLEVEEKFYPDSDGQLRFRGTYRNGKPHGTHIWFSEDGSIDSAKVFRNAFIIATGKLTTDGLRIGPWKEYYYPTGELKSEGEYVGGYRSGEWIYYFVNGQVEQRGKYAAKEKPDGNWRWFYEDGDIMREEAFKQGKEHGWLIEYADSGKVITKGEYLDGNEEGEWFYEIGDHQEIGVYEYGLRQGVWEHRYLSNNEMRYKGEFFDGLEQGEHIWYYDNGVKMLKGDYVSGVKEGEWIRYNRDGSIFVTIEYQSGQEVKVDGYKINIKSSQAEGEDD